MHSRLLVDPPARGDWNMAVDEVLLERAEQGGGFCLRLYRWAEPTLSLGYFQAHVDRALHPASAACPLVRRSSGGGAILHDQELTYSLAAPAKHPLATNAERLYITVHESLVAALGQFGIHAQTNQRSTGLAAADEPFLCFQRRAIGDLLVDGWKIAGSAQRRSRGAILQHGSILFGRSAVAPELPGLNTLSAREIPADNFEQVWLAALSQTLGLSWQRGALDADEHRAADSLVRQKFATDDWNRRR